MTRIDDVEVEQAVLRIFICDLRNVPENYKCVGYWDYDYNVTPEYLFAVVARGKSGIY